MVYTHENRFFVANAKNILESHNISVFLKNEHTSSIMGEAAALDAWVELWVNEDSDFERACRIIESSLSDKDAAPWRCTGCGEENDASFEFCWNCRGERP